MPHSTSHSAAPAIPHHSSKSVSYSIWQASPKPQTKTNPSHTSECHNTRSTKRLAEPPSPSSGCQKLKHRNKLLDPPPATRDFGRCIPDAPAMDCGAAVQLHTQFPASSGISLSDQAIVLVVSGSWRILSLPSFCDRSPCNPKRDSQSQLPMPWLYVHHDTCQHTMQ